MVRPGLAILAVALAAGFVSAAGDSQVQREYTNRVLSMANTAAAHVELARWCQANGLTDRARVHWQEAVARDADCAEARAALGFVKRNMAWVQVPAAPGAPGAPAALAAAAAEPAQAPPAAPQDPMSANRRRVLNAEVQDIFVTCLLSSDPQKRSEGRQRLLAIRDPAAAEPIARILSLGDDDTRRLACEALAGIPYDEAACILARFVLSDESQEVQRAAVAALASRQESRGLPQLTNALKGSPRSLNRAAYALGEIGDLAAAPALIAHLQTPETRILKAPASGGGASDTGAYLFTGTIITYVAGAKPVVANGAVGWDIQVGAIPVGTAISFRNPRVTIYRTIVEFVQRPAVHDALQKMLGEDHGYNSADWRAALARKQAEAAKTQP
jgi:hypothetical protein